MLLNSFACPHCGGRLKSISGIEEGRRVKCPQCEKVFAAAAEEIADTSPAKEARPAMNAPSRPVSTDAAPLPNKAQFRPYQRPPAPAVGDDEEESRPAKKRKKAKKEITVFNLAQMIAGVVALVLIAAAGFLSYKKRFVPEVVEEEEEPVAPVQRQIAKQNPPQAAPDAERKTGEGRIYVQKEGFSIVPPKDWIALKAPGTDSILTLIPPDVSSATFLARVIPFSPYDSIEQVREGMKAEMKLAPTLVFGDEGMVTIDGKKAYFVQFSSIPKLTGDLANANLRMKSLQYFVLSKKNGNKVLVLALTALPSDFDRFRKTFEESARTMRFD